MEHANPNDLRHFKEEFKKCYDLLVARNTKNKLKTPSIQELAEHWKGREVTFMLEERGIENKVNPPHDPWVSLKPQPMWKK